MRQGGQSELNEEVHRDEKTGALERVSRGAHFNDSVYAGEVIKRHRAAQSWRGNGIGLRVVRAASDEAPAGK